MSKRGNSVESLVVLHKKCNTNQMSVISIDHTRKEDNKSYVKALKGKTLGDNLSDIKFIVENEEIISHSQVLEILSNQRQLVRDLIERDKQLAKQQKCPEANIFQMSGTTPQAFKALLQYIYTGKMSCDLKTGIDLALTANKLKFHPLVASIAQQLALNLNDILRSETVDDLYHIGKASFNKVLLQECGDYMEKNAISLKELFMRRDIEPNDDENVLTYAFDKSRYNNYIHFLLPESTDICFNVLVSNDRRNWTTVQRNEEMWSKFWNWVYFKEMRLKYVRIICTDQENKTFSIRDIEDKFFLCKRANVELNFDPKTNYLIPKHNIIQYPNPSTKQYFDEQQKNGYTYVTSDAPQKDKERFYIYHRVGDGKPLEFYLPQTCLIDSIRFRLWDLDDRTYDFTVEVRREEENDEEIWHLIKNGNKDVFDKRSSWQIINFGCMRPVRWIRITGVRAPPQDPEFAIIHLECPPQNRNRSTIVSK